MKNFKFFKGVDDDKRINNFITLENPLHGLIQHESNNRENTHCQHIDVKIRFIQHETNDSEIGKREFNILLDQSKKNISLFKKLFVYLKHQYDSIFNPLN